MSRSLNRAAARKPSRIDWLGVGLLTVRYYVHDYGVPEHPETTAWEHRGDFRNRGISFPLSALRTAYAIRVLQSDGWEDVDGISFVKPEYPGTITCVREVDADTNLRLKLEGVGELNGEADCSREALRRAANASAEVFRRAEEYLRSKLPRVWEILFQEEPVVWQAVFDLDAAARDELARFLREHLPLLAQAADNFN